MPFAPLSLLVVVAAVISLAYALLSRYAIQRLDQPGARAFCALMILMSIVPFVVLGASWLGVRWWFLLPTFLFFVYAPLWTWFVLTYTGEERKLSWGKFVLFVILPAAGALNVLATLGIGPGRNDLIAAIRVVTDLYAFALLFGGALLMVRAAYTYASTDTRRSLSLVIGALLPVLVPVIVVEWYFAGTPVADAYLLGYLLSTIAFGYAVYNEDLFESVPVAEAIGRDIVVSQMDDGVVVVDDADRVVDANAAAEQLLGVDNQSVQNRPVDSLFEDDVTVPDIGESKEISIDDGTRILELSTTELIGSPDTRLGRILTIRDETDRVRRRQQLERLNRQNERLGRFVSVVSHDLRNPLSVADGLLETARETGDDRHFERIESAHGRIETIVDELLTMVQSGITVEETERVVLNQLIVDAWATVETADATLEVDIEGTVAVQADQNLLRHVLENLFRNAVEHNDSPVTVTVGLLNDPADGFYIADDGRGIPAAERGKIFEHGHTSDEDGTGFGLSIVAQFVLAHDWEITVTDSETGGARFEITDADLSRD